MILLLTFALFILFTMYCLILLLEGKDDNSFFPFALWSLGSMIMWLSCTCYYVSKINL